MRKWGCWKWRWRHEDEFQPVGACLHYHVRQCLFSCFMKNALWSWFISAWEFVSVLINIQRRRLTLSSSRYEDVEGKNWCIDSPASITFGPLRERPGRLAVGEGYDAARRPFIPSTCSHFVLAIQEEPPCERQPLEWALLLPVKQGAALWTILMHEWDVGLVGRVGGGGGGERERERLLCPLSLSCTSLEKNKK